MGGLPAWYRAVVKDSLARAQGRAVAKGRTLTKQPQQASQHRNALGLLQPMGLFGGPLQGLMPYSPCWQTQVLCACTTSWAQEQHCKHVLLCVVQKAVSIMPGEAQHIVNIRSSELLLFDLRIEQV